MDSLAQLLGQKSHVGKSLAHRPEFFRLTNEKDRSALLEIVSRPETTVIDEIETQIMDLCKTRNPKVASEKPIIQRVYQEFLGSIDAHQYGVWVYYPWSHKVIHLLDEQEFVQVRTVRNKYKLTQEEQDLLSTKHIGVVGLSVGHSVAMTVVTERICGKISIADFDMLELSNLNRIRTSTTNINVPKTVSTAREIAELDPFIEVYVYNDGITLQNAETFITANGGLDLLIEECDGIDAKILAREMARKHQIPVVMSMSDRGMLDVERFDKVPDYPLLHGVVDPSISYEFLSSLQTSKEKLPYMLPIIGTKTLSHRLQASSLEIGETITSWPQLASDVVLDGAICCNATRRILLGETLDSRRQWIDLTEIIYNSDPAYQPLEVAHDQLQSSEVKLASVTSTPSELSPSEVEPIISAIVNAPSPGNMQKWRWGWKNNLLHVFVDSSNPLTFSDNLYWGSRQAIGAIWYNIEAECAEKGIEACVEIAKEDEPGCTEIVISFKRNPAITRNTRYPWIAKRTTYRGLGNGIVPLSEERLNALKNTVISEHGISLAILSDRSKIDQLGSLICQGDQIRFLNRHGHAEFYQKELRWGRDDLFAKKDGLDITQFKLDNLDLAGIQIAESPQSVDFLHKLQLGTAFQKLSKRACDSADAMAIIYAPDYSKQHLLEAGKYMQAFWLECEAQGIGVQPMTILAALFTFFYNNKRDIVSAHELSQMKQMRTQLETILPSIQNQVPLFVCRLKHVTEERIDSPRVEFSNKLITI